MKKQSSIKNDSRAVLATCALRIQGHAKVVCVSSCYSGHHDRCGSTAQRGSLLCASHNEGGAISNPLLDNLIANHRRELKKLGVALPDLEYDSIEDKRRADSDSDSRSSDDSDSDDSRSSSDDSDSNSYYSDDSDSSDDVVVAPVKKAHAKKAPVKKAVKKAAAPQCKGNKSNGGGRCHNPTWDPEGYCYRHNGSAEATKKSAKGKKKK